MRRLGLALIGVLALGAGLAAAGEIQWRPTNWPAISREAQERGKLVFVYVKGPDCPLCTFFDKQYTREPAFTAWIDTLFVPVRADEGTHDGLYFVQQLGLAETGVPRFYLLDAGGRRLAMSYLNKTVPLQAVTMFRGLENVQFPFDPRAVTDLAQHLRKIKEGVKGEKKAIYSAMEAMAWQWAGRRQNANAAFGRGWANELPNSVKDWYVYFWGGWMKDNLPAAAAVAERGYRDGLGAHLARQAAIMHATMQNYPEAARLGELYLQQDPDDHQLAQAVQRWRMQR